MIQKDSYVNGTAARKFEYDVYEQNEVLKSKRQYKNNQKAKFKHVLSILTVFAAGLLIVYRFALITQISYNINESEKMYNKLRNENSLIRLQVERDTDLTKIKEEAETRFGMQKPDKSQIVYVKVPKNDYTVVMNMPDQSDGIEGNLFTGIVDKVAGFVNLIN